MRISKAERQKRLVQLVEEEPFITDEEIAKRFSVSVPTVRLDRLEMNIAEYKERVKHIAVEKARGKKTSCEFLRIEPEKSAIAVLVAEDAVYFENTNIVKGEFLYSFTEELASTAADLPCALVEVANIKYKKPVKAGDKLVGCADVKRKKNEKYTVWTTVTLHNIEVFRCKFILRNI